MTGKKATILVVDDDHDLLRMLGLRLRSVGYEVITVDNGEKALDALTVNRPHLVITDLKMEGMDGMKLYHAVRENNAALPVIMLTAHGSIPDAIEATNIGMFSFITKPFDSRDLLEQVERAIAVSGGAADSPNSDQQWRKEIITRSQTMEDLLEQAWLAAQSDASIFIRGDSGTGKELLARAIHKASPRRDKEFVAINCAAIPEPLLESELFGHNKGAFTGATQSHRGLLLEADGGTLFLDEIGDMPLGLQAKLLRVLQERSVRPVGSTKASQVDVRVISATHRDIDKEMKEGRFREDLYYRLDVVSFKLPTLAERWEDIPLLVTHALQKLAEKYNKPVKTFSADALELLVSSPLPGNIRQLMNVVEQCFTLCTTQVISANLVQRALREDNPDMLSLKNAKSRFERDYILKLLQLTHGNVTKAARLAKRNRTEFYKLLHRHEVDPAAFKKSQTQQAG